MHIENNLYKKIPQVDKLMQHELITNSEVYRHEIVEAVRCVLADLREGLKMGKVVNIPCDDDIAKEAVDLAGKRAQEHKGIRRVINGTGVILHSNLGRASLSKAAAEVAVEIASSYCTLEYDIEKGKRGNRADGIEKYLQNLTDCEASLIVNNNAAAVLLILSAIANDGNVIVSRGELVEIGGGFRVPDIISQCGCELREVGTTNKTRIADYEDAINKETRAILKVHTSNFKVVGFTESVTIDELAILGKTHNIPIIEDIGSGALVDVQKYGLHDEPLAKVSLKNGADIVSFSGDKLLGGLQCGIILGQRKYIDAMKKHPLYRAFRVDKMTIAVMEATLRVYADLSLAEREIPVLSMLSMTEEVLRLRADKLRSEIQKNNGDVEVIKTKSVAGGGAVPGLELDSYAIALKGTVSAEKMERKLREQPIPVIGRIENDRLLLDVRTIFEDDFEYVAHAVAGVSG